MLETMIGGIRPGRCRGAHGVPTERVNLRGWVCALRALLRVALADAATLYARVPSPRTQRLTTTSA